MSLALDDVIKKLPLPNVGSVCLRQPATNNLARLCERDKPVLNTNKGSFLHALVYELGHCSGGNFLILTNSGLVSIYGI